MANMRVTLEQWRMFKAVVDYGGFNQAAAKIHKSQSSIHSSVNKIENSLDVKLFKVIGRRTELTEAGRSLLQRAEFLLDEAQRVESVGLALSKGVETQLAVAIDEMFPQSSVFGALNQVCKDFPMLNIELHETVLGGAKELLNKHQVDLAISPYSDDQLFSESLCQIEFVAVAHRHHPFHKLSNQRALEREDLKQYRQIVVRDSATELKQDEGWLGAEHRWTVSHLKTSVDLILSGLGFAWLPSYIIKPALSSGELVPLKLGAGQKRYAQLFLLYQDKDLLGPAAAALIKQIKKQCETIFSLNDLDA